MRCSQHCVDIAFGPGSADGNLTLASLLRRSLFPVGRSRASVADGKGNDVPRKQGSLYMIRLCLNDRTISLASLSVSVRQLPPFFNTRHQFFSRNFLTQVLSFLPVTACYLRLLRHHRMHSTSGHIQWAKVAHVWTYSTGEHI